MAVWGGGSRDSWERECTHCLLSCPSGPQPPLLSPPSAPVPLCLLPSPHAHLAPASLSSSPLSFPLPLTISYPPVLPITAGTELQQPVALWPVPLLGPAACAEVGAVQAVTLHEPLGFSS